MGPAEQAKNKLGDKKNQKSGLSIPKPVFLAVPQHLPEIKSNNMQRKKKKKKLNFLEKMKKSKKINYKGNRTIRLKEPQGAPSISPVSGETLLNILECLFFKVVKDLKKRNVLFLSRVRLFATPGTVAYQAPLSMGFSRQEYCSGLPFPSPRTVKERTKKNHSVIHLRNKKN